MCTEFCKGCHDYTEVTDDIYLCAQCEEQLKRDVIRKREFDCSELTVSKNKDERKEIHKQLIKVHGKSFEIIQKKPELLSAYIEARKGKIQSESDFGNKSKKAKVKIKSYAASIYLNFRETYKKVPGAEDLHRIANLIVERSKKERIEVSLKQCLNFLEKNQERFEKAFERMVYKKGASLRFG